MSSIRTLLALTFLAGSFAFAPEAHAGKKETTEDPCKVTAPTITKSGIPEMDEVFTKAAAIQSTVASQTSEVCKARGHLNEALGIAADAPVGTAIADLKAKAMGKIKVATEGGKPKLEPTEAVPDNVKAAIDATNAMIAVASKAATESAGLLPEAKALGTTAAGFPMKVPTMKVEGVDIATAGKIVVDDVKAIKMLPTQIDGLGKQLELTVTSVMSAFGG